MKLLETKHPNRKEEGVFDSLLGIDFQKFKLMSTLENLLSDKGINSWKKRNHPNGLAILNLVNIGSPLIILSGEVGCGKTALANSIGTPLSEKINKKVITFETPSDIRGSGLVGEISARITATFEMVKNKLKSGEVGILIIDEADDLATSRSQNQAHHEDRAGLNVLIKQLDQLSKSNKSIAVIMITNRISVVDPAIQRRASLMLSFQRPSDSETLKTIFNHILEGTDTSSKEKDALVDFCLKNPIPYSYSDLIQRVGKQSVIHAVSSNKPFSYDVYMKELKETKPSPLIIDHINSIQ